MTSARRQVAGAAATRGDARFIRPGFARARPDVKAFTTVSGEWGLLAPFRP